MQKLTRKSRRARSKSKPATNSKLKAAGVFIVPAVSVFDYKKIRQSRQKPSGAFFISGSGWSIPEAKKAVVEPPTDPPKRR